MKIWVSKVTITQVFRETNIYDLDSILSTKLKIYQTARNYLKIKIYERHCTINILIKTVLKI